MSVVATFLVYALNLFLLLLLVRVIMGYVFMFSPGFRASGAVAALLEIVYTVTDPPVRLMRRLIPPLRVGRVSLEIGVIVLFIVTRIVIGILSDYR